MKEKYLAAFFLVRICYSLVGCVWLCFFSYSLAMLDFWIYRYPSRVSTAFRWLECLFSVFWWSVLLGCGKYVLPPLTFPNLVHVVFNYVFLFFYTALYIDYFLISFPWFVNLAVDYQQNEEYRIHLSLLSSWWNMLSVILSDLLKEIRAERSVCEIGRLLFDLYLRHSS